MGVGTVYRSPQKIYVATFFIFYNKMTLVDVCFVSLLRWEARFNLFFRLIDYNRLIMCY